MPSEIVIIAKKQSQHTFVVKTEEWLNPDMYVIDGQDPYTDETWVIEKSCCKVLGDK